VVVTGFVVVVTGFVVGGTFFFGGAVVAVVDDSFVEPWLIDSRSEVRWVCTGALRFGVGGALGVNLNGR
jgi:predicted PurR-regulated permease PerM